MKKITLFLFAIAILMVSCGDKNAYTITGTVSEKEYEGTAVYLQALGTDFESKVDIDSTSIENGKFKFSGLASDVPTINFLRFGDKGFLPLILEPGKIKISLGDKEDLPIIKGTPINETFFALITRVGADDSSDNPLVYNYLKDNIQSQFGAYFFAQIADRLSYEQKKELFASIAPEFKNNVRIKRIEDELRAQEVEVATAVGNTFTDLKAKDPEGKEAALSDYAGKGKYVLVDFWASWCPPCREEMPKLVELYAKYKDKDFEIVGISLDKEGEAWKNGINKLNITWPQISDLKYWDSALSAAYGVNGIPHLLLIDKDGKIIERGLNANEMAAKLAELIK